MIGKSRLKKTKNDNVFAKDANIFRLNETVDDKVGEELAFMVFYILY